MNLDPFELTSFGISDIGLVRSNNEDIWAALPDKKFFILADGMGGHKAGEIASSFAVESMCNSMKLLSTNSNNPHNIEETCQFLRRAIAKANSKVFKESQSRADYAGMGTTLSCFIIVGNFLIYAHVGDSRLYRYRNKLEQLSEDHSLRPSNWSREDEPSASPTLLMRNVITRAIGTHSTVLPDIGVIPLQLKDLYMLCSDGLTDYVEEDKIARVLTSPLPLEEMGKRLVKSALEKGGNDNITLLLVKMT